MRNIYGVKFKPNGKIYHFNAEKLECPINVTVIVRTERGEQFGKVVMKVNETDLKTSIEEISPIIRDLVICLPRPPKVSQHQADHSLEIQERN